MGWVKWAALMRIDYDNGMEVWEGRLVGLVYCRVFESVEILCHQSLGHHVAYGS